MSDTAFYAYIIAGLYQASAILFFVLARFYS